MEIKNQIQEVYQTSTSYPELVSKLIAIGIQSYMVDVASSIILYRLDEGKTFLHPSDISPRVISEKFNQTETQQAIKNNQQGKSDYPTFMNDIAMSGVRFYEATLIGNNKRVTYIGTGGCYEESIPL